ncbi:MAG TPA: S41 family peptidase [Candidatus Limnocylindrales bacterium]|nr:S41 family peptidase [Candidatus Limnocylindrales bacterium]
MTSPLDDQSPQVPHLDEPPPAAHPPGPGRPGDSVPLVATALLVLTLAGVALFAAGLSLGGQGVGRDADEQAAIEAFVETYRRITDEYVGESDPGELIEGAIEGMFGTLDDPYSAYLGPDEFESTFNDISGQFEGVGARMSIEAGDGTSCALIADPCALRVVEVLPDSPALAAGLLTDDIVSAVDGRGLEGHTLEDAVRLIRGPRDSAITLTVSRDGQELDLAITRDVIVSQDVRSARLADGRVGYLRIDSFGSRVAEGFEAALRDHLDAGIEQLIVDVRDDPGGFVDAAVEITSQFLPDGSVYWEEAADGSQRSIEVRDGGLATDPAIDVVVLVDDGTASASEILAGALQDAGRAELVGERTFGKGTVQEWTRLPGETGGFRLSIAKWLTRDRTWIDDVGLTPDVEVAGEGGRFWPQVDGAVPDAATVAADPQLDRAVSLLLDDASAD